MKRRPSEDETRTRPLIVQCSREIGEGGGVSGVAAQLESGFLAAGYRCHRVTLKNVGISPRPPHPSRVVNKLFLLRDVVWYTLAGSLYAKIRYSRRDAVVICHNDALFGDVYVNHGLHKLVVLESPNRARMIFRNPLHSFLLIREEIRHRLRIHKYVVTLCSSDTENVVLAYPSTRGRVVQLSNGVYVDSFADAALSRQQMRQAMGVEDNELILLFVGHEFDRKGLGLTIEALRHLDQRFKLWVVGGTQSMVSAAGSEADRAGVLERTRFFGTRLDGIAEFFGASDLFVLPSSYEATPLVMLEAMAAGLVPIMTRVGAAPDVIRPGVNGFLVDRDPESIAAAVREATETPGTLASMSQKAAECVQEFDWPRVVQRYIELVEKIYASRHG